MNCPTHFLHGQTFSDKELRDYIAKATTLGICKDCLHWMKKELIRRETMQRFA